MNHIVIDIISKNIKALEAGAFQEFCKKFFIIQENLIFERFGATSDGKTRKGTPDYLTNEAMQICLQISIEKTYWDNNETKPKEDIDKCINNIDNLQKIILCSSQGLNTANPNAKNNIITYGKNKNVDIICYSLETFEDVISQDLKKFHVLFQEYFNIDDFNYLKRYYQTKDDYLCICAKNIELYKQYITYKNDLIITRCQENDFYILSKNTQGTIFLVASSGIGKSSLCIQIANKHIESKQFSLWIKPEIIEKHENYEHWIIDALKEAKPDLSDIFIEALNEYFYDDGLLLIVDDINKTQSYRNCLNKLKNISAFIKERKANISIICPIWTVENDSDKQSSYIVYTLDSYNTEEAKDAIRLILEKNSIKTSDFSIESLIDKLNNDPYIIGLLDELNDKQIQNVETNTANDVQKQFLNNILANISEENPDYLDTDYKNTLFTFLYKELQDKVNKTNFNEISDKNIIRPILKNKKICQLDCEDNIVFRHDRLKAFLQVQTLINNKNISDEIIIEPFYADIIGEYIAAVELPEDKIKLIQEYNPIALLEAINYVDFNTHYLSKYILETFYQIYILKLFNIYTLQDENNNDYKDIGLYSNTIEYYANQALLKVTNKYFLNQVNQTYKEELKNIYTNGWLLLNFKNGSLSCGLYYYHKWISVGEFYINDNIFNECISYVKSKYRNDSISESCQKLINNCNSKYKKTALIISALLGASDINSCVEKFWNESEKDDVIAYCIFALIKCFNQNSKTLLKELIDYWLKMDDKKAIENQAYTPRSLVYSILCSAINQAPDEAIEYLISLASDKTIALYIAGLLCNIDKPSVYSFKVKFYADNNHHIMNHHKFNKINSSETLDCLKNIWKDESKESKYRNKALKFYEPYIRQEDIPDLCKLEKLKEIDRNTYILSCQFRARLGDPQVAELLFALFNEDEKNLIFIPELQNIWNRNLIQHIVEIYNDKDKEAKDIHSLADLLVRINKFDAESIILQCFEKYKKEPYFIQAMIIIGTDKLFNLAKQILEKTHEKIDFNLSLLNTKFSSDKFDLKLTPEIMYRIEKIAAYINSKSLAYIVMIGKRKIKNFNMLDRIKKHIQKEDLTKFDISIKDKNFYRKYLDKFITKEHIISSFLDIGLNYNKEHVSITEDEIKALLEILPTWFYDYLNLKAFNICARIIDLIGNRKNLSILESLNEIFTDQNDKNIANRILFNVSYSVRKESLI